MHHRTHSPRAMGSPWRVTSIAIVAAAAMTASMACQPTRTTTTTAPATPKGWTLLGGDEFNGSTLDTGKWKAYHNTYGDGNNELACLTPSNITIGGGSLKINSAKQSVTCPSGSTRQYSSGFLGSREVGRYYPMFARYEMRAKIPHAQGLWPAFWLRHRNGASHAEVDIMESFHSIRPGRTSATLHLTGRPNAVQRNPIVETPTATPGWHTWAVEITPATGGGVRFVYSIDGTTVLDHTETSHQWANTDPNATWDIAVNQAVGGNWVGRPDDTLGYLRDLNRCSLTGTAPTGCTTTNLRQPDWTTPGAATFEVDWVRVYTR